MAGQCHRTCGFVAPHVLKAIAACELVSQEVRKAAQISLNATDTFTSNRQFSIASATAVTLSPLANCSQESAHILQDVTASQPAGPGLQMSAEETLLTSESVGDTPAANETPKEPATKESTTRAPKRAIYDCKDTEKLQQDSIRIEGSQRVKDRSINNAYDGLGIVYDFYSSVFDRNSVDDKGLELVGNVHYEPANTPAGYDNAYWDGAQMVFGDGDGEIFNDFTDSLDVLAHELTHGVTQYTAKLEYKDQAGALNESMSDIFACMCEQWWFGQTVDEGDWLLGQGSLSIMRRGPALRSLKAPGTAYRNDPILGTDPQPAHMSGYKQSSYDFGGVHLNSGIPNHAFYLAAIGLSGFAWDKPGQIWYKTMNDSTLPPDCDFKTFAGLTVKHALALYGAGTASTVRSAWVAVGVVP